MCGLNVKSGTIYVEGIRFFYCDGTTSEFYGNNETGAVQWMTTMDNPIIRVTGRSDTRVTRLQFFTESDSSPAVGTSGGR